MAKLSDTVELAPLRALDDFLLSSARFQVPPYNDMARWAKRIHNNLLYYQTNYLLLIIVGFLIISLFHPREIILGFCSLTVGASVLLYSTSKQDDAVQFKKDHPLISLGVIALAGYFFVYTIGSVITFLFALAVPLLCKILHMHIYFLALMCVVQLIWELLTSLVRSTRQY